MPNQKTLYVSDLDETLLRSDERLSDFTVQALNALIERGMIFSYATARSYQTASEVTRGLSARLPTIVYNGTFILENGTQKKLLSNHFSKAESNKILSVLKENGLSPMVRAFVDDKERVAYCDARIGEGTKKYLARRVGDKRLFPVQAEAELSTGEIFCITCMDNADGQAIAYEALKEDFRCLSFTDVYTGAHWLEIQPKAATKANAIQALKEILGCDRVVCFGNGINDVCMFEIADECYAVGNAEDELKKIATAVIDTNDHDGVAKWLLEHFE